VRPWSPPYDLSAQGVIRLRGTADQLRLAPGTWTLVVAVGRPGALADEPERLLERMQAQVEGEAVVRWFSRTVVIADGD
jgi:hypothetical protein